MMEQYKQNRGLAKGSFTRILTFCQNPAATEAEIQVRVNKADEYFQQFETIQAEIEREPHTVDQANEYEKYRQQVEQIYYTIKAINVPHRSNDSQVSQHSLNTLIETIVQGQNNLGTLIQNMTPSTTSTPILQNSQPNGYRKPKLPQITIPEFDGQYTNWIRFRDLFESMIHNRADLSNVEKIEYLLGQLKGDALSVIRHITPSNDNYIPAWELIKKKYDDSESIKRAYLELLFDQSKMKVSSVVELNRLINKTHESVNALKALNEPIAHWDTVLIFHLERKLDAESHTLWCRQSSPFFEKFTEFLEQRLQELERRKHDIPSSKPAWQGQRERTTVNTSTFKNCPACKGQQHPLYNCNKFMTLPVNERIKLVRYNKMCYNCLQGNHQASECTRSACKKCNLKHNTLLHREVDTETSQVLQPTVGVNTVHKGINRFITVLPTARICIQDGTSEFRSCRALLDTGAQITLLSEACAQRLNIKRTYDKTALHGVGQGGMSYTNGKATIVMQTALPNKVISTVALCLTNLTQYQPAFKVDNSKLEYFNTLTLADPEYNSPGQVDLILGADILSECLLTDKIIHPSGSPCALATIFGWVIMGRIPTNQNIGINIAHVSEDLSDQLRKFWEIEELQDQKEHLTTEEQEAEDHYKKHFTRHIDGKYVVRLPFKTSNPYFGQTKPMAIKRFNTMEARFHHNNQLRQDYCRFMDEFIDLKHMELKGDSTEPRYYLPHHAVLKPSSTTTKLRVVFDGSAKGSNGMSLNEQLLIGPTIQNDLITILLQFRKYKVAMCSDIEKMYRQIIMHEKDRPYQCIVWRKNEEVETYCLNTVTYGTSAAPFLAIRTLKQIALDNCATHPMVSEVINNCFYVDDLMCSVPSESDAIELKNNLNAVLVQAQLHLRKWSSNADGVLRSIDVKDRATSVDTVIDRNKVVKTLGVLWDTSTDVFKYSVNITAMPNPLTKRTIFQQFQYYQQSPKYLIHWDGWHRW